MKPKNPIILGVTYGGHDTSAALMAGGEIVAACEQERYTLDKHSRRFPVEAVTDCLKIGGVGIDEVDELAFPDDPIYYIREKYLKPAMGDEAQIRVLIDDFDRVSEAYNMEALIREQTGFKGPIVYHLHHLAHLATAYYPSGFQEALVVSQDGVGEIETGLIAVGREGELEIVHPGNRYPDSLGLLYGAITHYLGWKHHCDEGIVMGLAPYGDPLARLAGRQVSYLEAFEDILKATGDYDFEVDRSWIAYHHVRDKWISDKFIDLFGPKRDYSEPLTDHHRNAAAALQRRLEDLLLDQLRRARQEFGLSRLALAGGVALNCSMNGKIAAAGLFDQVFVQPASGDNGLSVGACYLSFKRLNGGLEPEKRHGFYLGSRFSDQEIAEALEEAGLAFSRPADIYALTAEKLAEGKIVGWFQGAAEFGPRALGNRSILTKPYPAEMKDILNAKVKFREPFRPFAPAVLYERTGEYFQMNQESPHMLLAVQAVPQKAQEIAATVHVDNSCRVQTVSRENNPRFRRLLAEFDRITGCPVLLNTSFNVKGQPIVNTPAQAIACYLSTKIDVLVMGDFFCQKEAAGQAQPETGS